MLINVIYGASVAGAPAGLSGDVDAAVAYYESNFDAPGTVNITIGWGSATGLTIPTGALGATWPDGFYLVLDDTIKIRERDGRHKRYQ